ncbi:hypothetical protein [uncultured Sphingomonas sp.]|uniref:hypothetical protein n=1 Tax=uncultured Sphingomonas sp. TaxID=158754 RepID=UPI0035C98335
MANITSAADSAFSEDRNPNGAAQAQAALLLESLIHSLMDNGALTKDQALEAIGSAFEVKEESESEEKEPEAIRRHSLALLSSMRSSITAHSGAYDKQPAALRADEGADD